MFAEKKRAREGSSDVRHEHFVLTLESRRIEDAQDNIEVMQSLRGLPMAKAYSFKAV